MVVSQPSSPLTMIEQNPNYTLSPFRLCALVVTTTLTILCRDSYVLLFEWPIALGPLFVAPCLYTLFTTPKPAWPLFLRTTILLYLLLVGFRALLPYLPHTYPSPAPTTPLQNPSVLFCCVAFIFGLVELIQTVRGTYHGYSFFTSRLAQGTVYVLIRSLIAWYTEGKFPTVITSSLLVAWWSGLLLTFFLARLLTKLPNCIPGPPIRVQGGKATLGGAPLHFPTYATLYVLFCSLSLLTNLLILHPIHIGSYLCTAALFTYSLTFVGSDLLAELYGASVAKSVVWGGFYANVLFLAILSLFRLFTPYQGGLTALSASGASLVSWSIVASMAAYLAAQLTDVYLFDLLRTTTSGRYLWLRNNTATILSQLLDTAIFTTLAWVLWQLFHQGPPPFSWGMWLEISRNEYLLKVMLALLDTPIVYLLLYLIRRFVHPTGWGLQQSKLPLGNTPPTTITQVKDRRPLSQNPVQSH